MLRFSQILLEFLLAMSKLLLVYVAANLSQLNVILIAYVQLAQKVLKQ